MNFNPEQHPHRRHNALTGEWILVSPQRTQRPWQGQRETAAGDQRPAYDPQCDLCPGNSRAGGHTNPKYDSTCVFTDDFAAILPDTPLTGETPSELFQCEPVRGECRIICFSPRHDLALPEMALEDILRVVNVWVGQLTELGASHRWVQIFEDKGAVTGCSNPHPHGQIWAGNFLPRVAQQEELRQGLYEQTHGHPLLLHYLERELNLGTRVVGFNAHWAMVVPFWAAWPFELLLLPRRHVMRLPDLSKEEQASLAAILKTTLTRYDNLFETSFPYSMGWHGAPTDDGDYDHWQLHAHFYPPLLGSATMRRFTAGYEMLAEPQRDLTAEQAAQRLRDLPTVHYKTRP